LSVIIFIAGSAITGCQSSATKVEKAENNLKEAKENVIEARVDLYNARNDSVTEYQKFKKDAEEKIIAQNKSITEFKARISKEKKENRAKYEKKLAELEQKNSDLKKKLDDYKDDGQDKWTSFKIEFNHDMDELGKAFKDLTVKNTK
jgi:3-dehydroquinate dehydratase